MMHRQLRSVQAIAAVAIVVAATAIPGSAALIDLTPAGGNGTIGGSILLSELLDDPTDTVIVGDKVFTGFGYTKVGDMPTANLVSVAGLKDAQGHWGLRFQGPFLDLPGGGASDAHISFMVEVSALAFQQGWRITDAHLNLFGVGGGEDSFFSVDETITHPGGAGLLNTHWSTLGPRTVANPDVVLSDVEFISPGVRKLNVVKDILAIASDDTMEPPVRGTVIDQSFSQELIPEPASAAMFGMCGLALIALQRRRG